MNRKITNDIHQVGGSGRASPEDAAVYLIDIDGRGVLIDAGCGRNSGRRIENIHS